jgi:hypothetical protein
LIGVPSVSRKTKFNRVFPGGNPGGIRLSNYVHIRFTCSYSSTDDAADRIEHLFGGILIYRLFVCGILDEFRRQFLEKT